MNTCQPSGPPLWNIGNTTYFHKYYPTVFDGINVPWYKPNNCPFAHMNPIEPNPFFPPNIGTPLHPYKTKTAEPGTCGWGEHEANILNQNVCCDAFNNCHVK